MSNAIGVPVVVPSKRPERISTRSDSCRCETWRDVPGLRRSSSFWISSTVNVSPGGTTIDDAADGRSVAFAERRDGKECAERIPSHQLGMKRIRTNCVGAPIQRIHLDVEFLQLRRIDRRRRLGHQALRLLRLGKGNHISNGIGPAKQHDQPIEPEGDAAVRRSAVIEGFQKKPNLAWAWSLVIPSKSKIRNWISLRWFRILPPPISLPFNTMS